MILRTRKKSLSLLFLLLVVMALASALVGCDDDSSDADQPLRSVEPNSLNPVNAVDKAQEAHDIQEDLDQVKQEQMDDIMD